MNEPGMEPQLPSSINNQIMKSYQQAADASALMMRLDTSHLIESIEDFLTGTRKGQKFDKDTKKWIQVKEQLTEPVANKEGIQRIMNKISMLINPSTVQGNWIDDKAFDNYIYEVHTSLASTVMDNLHRWEIKISNYDYIIDSIMEILVPFTSRLLKNEERKSYGTSLIAQERNDVIHGNKRRGIFGLGG